MPPRHLHTVLLGSSWAFIDTPRLHDYRITPPWVSCRLRLSIGQPTWSLVAVPQSRTGIGGRSTSASCPCFLGIARSATKPTKCCTTYGTGTTLPLKPACHPDPEGHPTRNCPDRVWGYTRNPGALVKKQQVAFRQILNLDLPCHASFYLDT